MKSLMSSRSQVVLADAGRIGEELEEYLHSSKCAVQVILPTLVSESDLHITQLTLALLTSISLTHRQAIWKIQKSLLS